MVRLKQTFPETVQLYISGPKSILTEPVTADARLSHTWFEFLNGELGLEVIPESGIFVCTANYTPTAPKEGQGWRSDLGDEIHEFIMKFERKRKQFSVRLCHPNNILTYNYNHTANFCENGTLGSPPPTTNGDHTPNGSGPSNPGPSRVMNISPIVPPGTLHSNQRPNIVISTTAGLMGPPPPPPPVPGRSTKNNQNQKQRYSNANGSSSQQANGNTPQQTYGTRQKRHHEQSETLPETTLRSAGGKLRRLDNASMPPPPPPQSHSRTTRTRAFRAPNFVASLSAVKVEPVVEPQWDEDEFWDESSAVNGQDGGGANGHGGEGADSTTNGDGHHQEEEELTSDSEGNGAADDDEEEDNLSLMTAATAEENELRNQGIRVEDVKSLAEGRMGRFSNAYMLRVRNEIRKLKKNNMWDRNVNRAPLACYLLQEVFRE